MPPSDISDVVFKSGGIDARRQWGSAVVSFRGSLTEVNEVRPGDRSVLVDLRRTFPGAMTMAQLAAPQIGGDPIVLVSLYGMMEGGYAVTTVHRMLSDLTYLLDSGLGKNVIVGGDLNCSTQFTGRDGVRHRNLFERFKTLGLTDVLKVDRQQRPRLEGCACEDDPCLHIQTYRHNLSDKPWQNDYLFCTSALQNSLVCAKVEAAGTPDPWSLSDHLPIMAEFDFAL